MIDIIIPVYNTPKKDLERCFESILRQTFKNYKTMACKKSKGKGKKGK